MKTTSILSVLAFLLIGVIYHASPPLVDTQAFSAQENRCLLPEAPPTIGKFYIMTHRCPEMHMVHCCCSDGNMLGCMLQGISFSCIPGGPFECSADLSGCQESELDCDICCKPCMV